MGLFEFIFRKVLGKLSFNMCHISDAMFQDTSKVVSVEVYPEILKFNISKYQDTLIGEFSIKFLVLNKHIPDNSGNATYKNTVRIPLSRTWKKNKIRVYNKLFREAVKKYFKDNKKENYKECLLEYVYITDETPNGTLEFKLDTVYKKYNKFIPKIK